MKRVYAEMILKGMMSGNSENIIANILDWMETINDDKSNSFMDIITGVEKRNTTILKSLTENDIIDSCERAAKNSTTRRVLSTSAISEVSYNDEFSTRPTVVSLYLYEYKSNNKLSPEKASEFELLKAEFIKKYDRKIIMHGVERDEFDKKKSELYNFCSRNSYDGEDAMEVNRVDYSTITVTL